MNFSGFFIPRTKNQNLKKSKRRLQFWATGMIEAQSFIAFKSKGCYIVKTYNLTSYKAITESKLSFENWDLAVEEYNGDITIKASLKIPAKQESLNQVWQVGSAVTNGMPKNTSSRRPISPRKIPWPSPAEIPAAAGIFCGYVCFVTHLCLSFLIGNLESVDLLTP